jgi:hypothetical protein
MTFGIRSGLTGAEMRGRNTGCRRTVVSYGHRRNYVAIQQAGAPEIAYRDAAAIDNTHVNPSIPTPRYPEDDGLTQP